MNLSNLFKSRATREAEASGRRQIARAQEFCYLVDFLVEFFDWPSDAVWIDRLKRMPDRLIDEGSFAVWLRELDPNYTVTQRGETIEITELPFGSRVIPLADLIRWWASRQYLEDLVKIVADGNGTRFEYEWGKVINAQAGAIDPLRFRDPGNRYRNACALIKEFTGVKLDWREHHGLTRVITVTREDDGSWTVKLDQLQPTG